jgi:hypothetical protein
MDFLPVRGSIEINSFQKSISVITFLSAYDLSIVFSCDLKILEVFQDKTQFDAVVPAVQYLDDGATILGNVPRHWH